MGVNVLRPCTPQAVGCPETPVLNFKVRCHISENHLIGTPCRGNLKLHKKKTFYQSTSMDGTPEVIYRRSFRLQSLRLVKKEQKPTLLVYFSPLEMSIIK